MKTKTKCQFGVRSDRWGMQRFPLMSAGFVKARNAARDSDNAGGASVVMLCNGPGDNPERPSIRSENIPVVFCSSRQCVPWDQRPRR